MISAKVSVADITPALRKQVEQGLQRAVVHLHTKLLEALNTPNTGVRIKRRRGKGAYTTYPTPSKPGEPPRKRTGWLQRSVVYQIDRAGLSATVGVTANARYGAYLELGTARVAARPWLLATLASVREEMVRLATPRV